MRTYSQMNKAEKWICDSVTATSWFPSDGLPDTDPVGIFVRAQHTIRALDAYQAVGGVSTAAITEAIHSRHSYLVSLSDE